MFKSLFILLFVSSFLFGQDRIKIAVLNLEGEGVGKSETNILTERLRMELIETGKFSVVERSVMKDILKEQGFQQTGCTSQDCAVQMGQLIGVQQMIAGSIGKIEQTYFITLRIINVEKGEIIKTAGEEVTGSLTDVLKYGIKRVAQKIAETKVDKMPKLAPPPPTPQVIQPQRTGYPPAVPMKPLVKTPLGKASFSIEPFGLLLFGPSITAEIQISKDLCIAPLVRFASMGLVYNLLQGDEPSQVTGLGLGASILKFTDNPQANHKFFFGGGLEFIAGSYVDGKGEDWEVTGSDKNLVFYGKGGHRWRQASGLFFNLGGFVGGYLNVAKTWARTGPNLFENSPRPPDPGIRPALGMELNFGKEF